MRLKIIKKLILTSILMLSWAVVMAVFADSVFNRLENEEKTVRFIAELPTPGEYTLFANGGWNGNWYVGYDHSWISEIPPVNIVVGEKVYLGAKLGRSKTLEQIKEALKQENSSLDDVLVDRFKIFIGVSESKKGKPEGIELTTNDEIPREGSLVMALEGIGSSKWFWVEIDRKLLSSKTPNFIHLWSESKELNSPETAPILAAGVGSNEKENSYLVKNKDGKRDMSIIKYFEPAVAVKLVKDEASIPVIKISTFKEHPIHSMKYIVETKVTGDYITEVGMQLNRGNGWENLKKTAVNLPFDLLLNIKGFLPGKYKVRSWVKDWCEKISYSSIRTIKIDEK